MVGFSAGCCLANLYIQGGDCLFDRLDYPTTVFQPAALVGFYGPYDFASRQAERKSSDAELNRLHSPSYWIRQEPGRKRPPVLHIQGDLDETVFPDQHQRFQRDCAELEFPFQAITAAGFGHRFAPRDTNAMGEQIDLGPDMVNFLQQHVGPGRAP